MAEYHVGCGMSGIYAGTMKKGKKDEWRTKSDVTDEAIQAVANWMYYQVQENDKSFGYAWKTKHGKVLSLICTIEDVNEDKKEGTDVSEQVS